MIRNRVAEILKEQKKSSYWLYMQMGMSPENFSKIAKNKVTSIKFSTLESMCEILKCTVGDILVYEPPEDKTK